MMNYPIEGVLPPPEVAEHLSEGEVLLFTQPDVTLATVGQEAVLEERGVGRLNITTSRILVLLDGSTFSFHASSITMHAVARNGDGSETFDRPCIYCQLSEDDATNPSELYLAPRDADTLNACFRAFSQAALLNPPPDEDDEAMMMGGDDLSEEEEETPTDQASMLAHLDSILQVPAQFQSQDGQFDDTEDDDDDDDAPTGRLANGV